MKKIIIFLILFINVSIFTQDKKDESKFEISISGFVKTDFFYDTRQSVNIREGHFLLYPDNISLDAENNDINASQGFNILSIQSRVKIMVTAPEILNAKPSAVIEADFFGNENSSFSDVNGFRLRHAFVKLNWSTTELLAGQFWHPMFIAESFPGVLSFNTGAPFQPFSRNPQIRLTKSFGNLKLIGCIYTQRDFTGIGPEYTFLNNKYTSAALSSSKFLRNSGIPDMHFQFQYKSDYSRFLAGAGADYKIIKPELFTVNNSATAKFKSDKTLGSFSAIGFMNFKLKPVNVKLEAVYAQNAYDMVMLGGYAVKEITDTATGLKDFTNLNTLSVWTDINTNGEKIQFGLFAGYTKNLGSSNSVKGAIYARGSNIDYVYRIAPRLVFITGKLIFGAEGEYTFVMYGKANGNMKGGVTNGNAVNNLRTLLSVIYNF